MPSLRILMVTDHARSGGAAVAATRLQSALEEAGCTVIRVAARTESETGVIGLPGVPGRELLGRALSRFGKAWSHNLLRAEFNRVIDRVRPDVVNLHNLHGGRPLGWSMDLVEISAARLPTVWTLHDMWSFTGSCAYSFDCERWITGCDSLCTCPDAYPKLSSNMLPGTWEEKARFLRRRPAVVAVSPSRWLAEQARAGLWRDHDVASIANSLDLGVFAPAHRDAARDSLDLRSDERVLLASAENLKEPRKGGSLFADALSLIETRPLTVLLLGKDSFELAIPGVEVHELGYVDGEGRLAQIYSAADLLIHPAPQDNYPNVVAESLACGTPIVAFRTGGLPEMITPGQTGWLVDDVSAPALGRAVDQALADQELLATMRLACRREAEQALQPRRQAAAYLDLFGRIIKT